MAKQQQPATQPEPAKHQKLVAELAGALGERLAREVYGDEGPELDCDIDEMEELAVQAAKAAFDEVLAHALALQNERLPEKLPCPDCGHAECEVRFEQRTLQGRLGSATICEPACYCPACKRDFFPSAGSAAAGQPLPHASRVPQGSLRRRSQQLAHHGLQNAR